MEMAEKGRPKGSRKYTEKRLLEACDAYFASISYTEPALRAEMVLEEDGRPKLDCYGHPMIRYVPIITADGKEAVTTRWAEPPSLMALYLYLGINKSTFARYAEDPQLGEVVAYARGRVEAYLASRLEDKGAANGVKFNLEHNFGWKNKQNDSQGGKMEIQVNFASGGEDPFG